MKNEQTTTSTPEIRTVPIEQVTESPYNPRRLFNTEKLNELAASIREQGIINPLVTRAVNAHFELVAGARRRRAAELAGLTHVPIMVRELTDIQAREIALIDNAQREDVHPMHEAISYQELLSTAGWDVEKLSARMGKHERHIFKRLQICKLIEPLQQIFVDGYLTLGAAYSISRIDQPQQEKFRASFFDKDETKWYTTNEGEANRWIQNNVLTILSNAIWELDDAELVPAASSCSSCAKRTCANTMLFEEATSEEDSCLDPACFQSKRAAFLDRKRAKLAKSKKGYLEISDHYRSGENNTLLGTNSYVVCPRGECEYSKDGLIVEGAVGKVRHVCAAKECKRHQQFLHRGGGMAAQDREQQKLAEFESDIRATVFKAILRRFTAPTREHLNLIAKVAAGRLNHENDALIQKLYGLEPPKGGFQSDDTAKFYARIPSMTDLELTRFMLAITLVGEVKVWVHSSKKVKRDGPLFDIAKELAVPVEPIIEHHTAVRDVKAKNKGKARTEGLKALKVPDPILALPEGKPLAIRKWAPKGQMPCEDVVAVWNDKPDAAGYIEVVYLSGQHVAAKPKELRPYIALQLPAPEKKKQKQKETQKIAS